MAMDKKCGNDTEQGCPGGVNAEATTMPNEWMEEEFMYGFRKWHIMFLSMGAVLSFVILLCCCFKFRIPRTKQEIEGDYVRRRILRKFRQRLKAIQNQELDEMDLKRALDKIRAEFKSDTESLAQSEAGFSVATISSTGLPGAGGHHGSTYRRASQIQIDISLEDLRAQSMGFGARLALTLSRLFNRSKVSQSEVPLGENGTLAAGNGNKVTGEGQQGESKSTTIIPNAKTQPSKLASVSVTIPEGAVASASKEKSDKKNKGKSKEMKGKDDQCVAPVENLEAKVITEKSNKRSSKKKDDAEKGKSEKPEKDNKTDKEKEKHDKAEKLKADKEKEKKDKLEKEREKKEKLEKEKKEKKEKAELEKKEKAEREKKEKATKSKEKEQKAKTSGAVKENNIKDKK